MNWSSLAVAAGILVSRLAGLVRVSVFAKYFGLQSDAADAFNAAFRIPNFLQNLFGEGALSASFIPVYAGLRARDQPAEAARVAVAVASLLALIVSLLVLGGVLVTPWLIALIAPGFAGEKRAMTIRLVRILFPGAGLLVMSAWCLGVLNSHRRFFLSYAAPVIWNAVMIATLVVEGRRIAEYSLATALAVASVVGSLLQFLVQLPVVLTLIERRRTAVGVATHVRTVAANFVPAFVSRGVVQISAYVDTWLASFLPTGAVTGLLNAQMLYTLPVSLFGMSVSAAELPAMSGAVGLASGALEYLRGRLDNGLRQIAFFVVPSAAAFLAFGDIVAGAIFQRGLFTHEDSVYVWGILAGSAVGLLASTLGRLYASTYYALRDTRTPLWFALIRVALTTGLGYVCALVLPPRLGISLRWGAAGLTASAGFAAWVEFALLRYALNRRIGPTGLARSTLVRLWGAALGATAIGWTLRVVLPAPPTAPILRAIVILLPYGVAYIALTWMFGVAEARDLSRRLRRIRSRT
jgi:putative peptidoglycan lipid II flippase